MIRRVLVLLLVLVTVTLASCSASMLGGLNRYSNPTLGCEFLYPNGWLPVKAQGIEVAFRDLIEPTENVSLVVSPIPDSTKTSLSELGTPSEIGYKLSQNAIAPPNSGRQAELVNATATESAKGKIYYFLEYDVTLPDQKRHNLASVVVSRGKLFTFNASTTADRWSKVQDLLKTVVRSFSVS